MQRVSTSANKTSRENAMLETARDALTKLREMSNCDEQYVENIWNMRYPVPPLKASNGWPFKSAADQTETPNKVRALRNVKS